jgi:hypothetical protein
VAPNTHAEQTIFALAHAVGSFAWMVAGKRNTLRNNLCRT